MSCLFPSSYHTGSHIGDELSGNPQYQQEWTQPNIAACRRKFYGRAYDVRKLSVPRWFIIYFKCTKKFTLL
jgi:hypothetical protein